MSSTTTTHDGDDGRGVEVGNEEGQGVADAARRPSSGRRRGRAGAARRGRRACRRPTAPRRSPSRCRRRPRPRGRRRKAFHELWVAKAAANTGASVETEPSIRPTRPGWMICRMNRRRSLLSSAWRALSVRSCFSRSAALCDHACPRPRRGRRAACGSRRRSFASSPAGRTAPPRAPCRGRARAPCSMLSGRTCQIGFCGM